MTCVAREMWAKVTRIVPDYHTHLSSATRLTLLQAVRSVSLPHNSEEDKEQPSLTFDQLVTGTRDQPLGYGVTCYCSITESDQYMSFSTLNTYFAP